VKTNTINRNTEALLQASREVAPEVNAEKTNYIVMSCHQRVRKNHSFLTDNKSFENIAKCKYMGTTVTNQNCIHEKITSRLNSRNVCYYSAQSLLFCLLLSKNLNIKIYQTITLPAVLYVRETWSLTLKRKHRLMVLKRIRGPKGEEVVGGWK